MLCFCRSLIACQAAISSVMGVTHDTSSNCFCMPCLCYGKLTLGMTRHRPSFGDLGTSRDCPLRELDLPCGDVRDGALDGLVSYGSRLVWGPSWFGEGRVESRNVRFGAKLQTAAAAPQLEQTACSWADVWRLDGHNLVLARVEGRRGRRGPKKARKGEEWKARTKEKSTSGENRTHKCNSRRAHHKCNSWVFCPQPVCFSPGAHRHTLGECWMKDQRDPAAPSVNMRGAYTARYRARTGHHRAPPMVDWISGTDPADTASHEWHMEWASYLVKLGLPAFSPNEMCTHENL